MTNNFKDKIFFYCSPQLPPERGAYPHSIVCLAEGFKHLNISFHSNINFWQLSLDNNDYLFCYDPSVTPDDCSIVILDCDWFIQNNDFPERLFHSKRDYITVYFERPADAINLPKNSWQPKFSQFDFIFRNHYNSRFKYSSNVYPWAFGFSDRILLETQNNIDFKNKQKKLLFNFRLDHPLREEIRKNFLPLIQISLEVDESVDQYDTSISKDRYHSLQWLQTGMRHYPSYYQRLQNSIACACFGGLFINPWPLNAFGPTTFLDRVLNKVLIKLDPRPRRLMNWDSFRFWESLAAGCVTFHVDLERYGAVLPVMPENWQHYIGIDWQNMGAAVDRIVAEPEILEKIAKQGQQWSLEHYGPVPTALRFLKMLEQPKNMGKL
jgi:hypothetical protein